MQFCKKKKKKPSNKSLVLELDRQIKAYPRRRKLHSKVDYHPIKGHSQFILTRRDNDYLQKSKKQSCMRGSRCFLFKIRLSNVW